LNTSSAIHQKIYPHIKDNDVAWVNNQIGKLSREELDYALICCAWAQPSWELTETIINFGADNLEEVCYTAMSAENYQLMHKIMKNYSQPMPYGEKINIFARQQGGGYSFPAYMLQKGDWLELFQMILDGLPNHTQRIASKDNKTCNKTYYYKHGTYHDIYNSNLGFLIDLYACAVKDSRKDSYRQGIDMMLHKKFPINDNVISKIKHYHLEDMFGSRLNSKNRDRTYSNGLSHRRVLSDNDSQYIDQQSLKNSVFFDFESEFKFPESVTDYMVEAFQNYKGKVMPEEEEYAFFQTLHDSKNKTAQKLFQFFDRYYFLDKLMLYHQIQAKINTDDNISMNHAESDTASKPGLKI
jgi:hypothetical protein